ncbi:MAG: ATP-binding protein [Candidatus Altiarchaeota archaeon]
MPDKEVGYLTGSVRPSEFDLKLTDRTVGWGTFIKVKHPVHGFVLAKIDSLKTYLDDFDENETQAHAYTVGYYEGGEVLSPRTPFNPAEKVFLADKKIISDVLSLGHRRENSIYLGLLEASDIPVYLDVKKTIGKHISVLAKTGAGKSYAVAVILEELLKNDVPVVVIDPHGEYSSLCVDNDEYDGMLKYSVQVRNYADQVVEYTTDATVNPSARRFSLHAGFSMEELLDLMPITLTEKEKSVLYTKLQETIHDYSEEYTLQDLMDKIEEESTKYKWKVLDGLSELKKSGVFDGHPTPYSELVADRRCSIINLKGTEPRIQQLVVARLTKELFHMRTLGKIPEVFYLVEEAHNFCPERGFGDVMSSTILRTVAGEGRKFGFHLCVVSQRPARIDKNVLSQCTTQIILKVTNPNDLQAIRHSIEGFTAGMEEEIQQLNVGHALVVSEALKQPITVGIRTRETKHGAKPKYDEAGKVQQPPKPPPEKLPKKVRERMEELKSLDEKRGEKEAKTPASGGLWGSLKGLFIEPEGNKTLTQKISAIFVEPDDSKPREKPKKEAKPKEPARTNEKPQTAQDDESASKKKIDSLFDEPPSEEREEPITSDRD